MKKYLNFLFVFQVLLLTVLLSNIFAAELYADWDYLITTGSYGGTPPAQLIIDVNCNGIFGDTSDISFTFPPNSYAHWRIAVNANDNLDGLYIEYHSEWHNPPGVYIHYIDVIEPF